ncbi:MAG: type II toxin-antitoxin system RelE/ParE family toxin [bacterium]|jgi:mRNA-degrading endonuclease RelE of RelBE toxin-antitoxin system|nr:type II toxin-antitoxin system RelE/ParE family toxin [bacterium]
METKGTYKIRFTKKAHRKHGRLPRVVQLKLDKITELWVENPRTSTKGFKPLPGKNEYRCWVGRSHRVEWMVDDDERTVTIVDIGSREGM